MNRFDGRRDVLAGGVRSEYSDAEAGDQQRHAQGEAETPQAVVRPAGRSVEQRRLAAAPDLLSRWIALRQTSQ
jgi:hypothetical protein